MIRDPYSACQDCVVKDWCARRTGESPLPQDYHVNPECNGHTLLEKAIKLADIPREYRYVNARNYVFDKDNQEWEEEIRAAFERSVDLVSKGANIALIHDHKGTGKTRTALTIANEFIFKACVDPEWFDFENPLVYYMKYGKWANELRQMYQIDDRDFNLKVIKQLEVVKNVPLLIMDDIGSGRLTDYVRDLTYDILDHRKENMLSTIVTSNLSVDTLNSPKYLGEANVSRMMFNTVLITLGGRNRRAD